MLISFSPRSLSRKNRYVIQIERTSNEILIVIEYTDATRFTRLPIVPLVVTRSNELLIKLVYLVLYFNCLKMKAA